SAGTFVNLVAPVQLELGSANENEPLENYILTGARIERRANPASSSLQALSVPISACSWVGHSYSRTYAATKVPITAASSKPTTKVRPQKSSRWRPTRSIPPET